MQFPTSLLILVVGICYVAIGVWAEDSGEVPRYRIGRPHAMYRLASKRDAVDDFTQLVRYGKRSRPNGHETNGEHKRNSADDDFLRLVQYGRR